ncbi:unnamed protein product [Leptosia nina]|uniref:Ribosomal protein L1 n=1 Tax=Leptosia nina TaxID=320188 RepID=A0AAV1JEZ1_9NEOP
MVAVKLVKKKSIKETPKGKVIKLKKSILKEAKPVDNFIESEISTKNVSIKKVKYVYPSKNVNENIVDLTLDALNKLTDSYNTKNMIFGDETPIFVQITSIKIQDTKANIKLVLPHSTCASTGEICLITPDIKKGKKPDHEPTIERWEELLSKAGVTSVKTILPMRQLRVEYDQYELKRRLMTQHDFIMVDKRVLTHVSTLLGTKFFKKHNMLVPVKINEQKDLKKAIDVGLRSVMLRLSEGATSTVVVGHTGMPKTHLSENILALIKQLALKYPGGEYNIRSLSIKLPLSISLPLYLTLRSSNFIAQPKIKKPVPKAYTEYEDELSTIPGAMVKVAPDGSVTVTKKEMQSDDEDMQQSDEEDSNKDEDMVQSSENEDE